MSYEIDHGVELNQRQRIEEFFANLSFDPKSEGVSTRFLDSLERVGKSKLKDEMCAICRTDFLDDEYPLVVELPCKGKHLFDLECVSEWLLKSGSCPVCRHNFTKKETPQKNDDEEEYDDMYA